MRTIVHNRGEASLDALEAVLVRTVIKVQGDGNGHTGCLDGGLHHVGADLEAAHPLSSTSGALKNQRGLRLLGGLENGERPLEVVGVEGAQRVVTGLGLLEHLCCVNEHTRPPNIRIAHNYAPRIPLECVSFTIVYQPTFTNLQDRAGASGPIERCAPPIASCPKAPPLSERGRGA